LCLSETKIKNSIYVNVTLPGFDPVVHADSLTNAGGVGVLVATKFQTTVMGKMN